MKTKNLKHNYLMYSLRLLVNTLFGILIFPHVAKTLGAVNLGKVEFVMSIVSYFILLINLGIPSYGKREVAYIRNDKRKLSKLVLELIIILSIMTLVSIVLYILAINSLVSLRIYKELFLINLIYLLFNIFKVEWFFQGIEDQEYITKREMILKLISIFLIYTFVKGTLDFNKYIKIIVFSMMGANLINFKKMCEYLEIKKSMITEINLKKHLKPILVLFITSVATVVFTSVDSIMIKYFINERALGYYSLANKLGRMPLMIILSAFPVLYPRLCTLLKEESFKDYKNLRDKSLEYSLILGFPSAVGMFILSNDIIKLLAGSEFIESIKLLKVFSLLLIVMCYAVFTGQNLIINKKEKLYLNGQLLASIGNVIFNIIFINLLGPIGAAMGTIFAEIIAIFYRVYYGKKLFNTSNLFDKNKQKMLVSSLMMGLLILIFPRISDYLAINILYKILLGIVTYIYFLYLFREENLCSFKKGVRNEKR